MPRPGIRQRDRMDGQSEAVSSLTTDKLRRLKRSRGGHKSFVSKTRETLESIFNREETLSILDLEELKKNAQALRQSQDMIREKDNQIEGVPDVSAQDVSATRWRKTFRQLFVAETSLVPKRLHSR